MYYKTLTKLAQKRRSIPILSQIAVSDSYAVTNSLDNWIYSPSFLEEGMYYKTGFSQGKVYRSDLPIIDFPFFEKPSLKDLIYTYTFSEDEIEALKWVNKAVSKEETRYYLNGVYFGKDEVAATDGHRCHTFKYKPKWKKKTVEKGEILHRISASLIFDALSETKEKSFEISFYENNKFIANVGSLIICGKTIDGSFPDYKRVFPEYEKKKQFFFDRADFKAAQEKCKDISSIGGVNSYSVRLSDKKVTVIDHCALVAKESLEFETRSAIKTEIGFNIHYLMDMCDGVVTYENNTSPVIFSDRRGKIKLTGVLMPLRI